MSESFRQNCGHVGVIRMYHDICQTAAAARYIGSKAGELRKYAKQVGPGARLTNPVKQRSATFLGGHPDGDYMGDEWWQIATTE